MHSKKNFYLLFAVVLILLLAVSGPVSASGSKVNIVLNGDLISLEPPPVMTDDQVWVPLRPLAEAMQAKVKWFADDNRIEVERGFRSIKLWIPEKQGSNRYHALVNGQYTELDRPPRVIKGVTYVPVRLVCEGLGAEISWNESTSTVSIEIPVPKELKGLAAGVRDAVYQTALAESFKFTVDVQIKTVDFPEMNLAKLSGTLDKNDNFSLKGHLMGWPLESVGLDENYYVKSLLFNDKWVNLAELDRTKREVDQFKQERQEAKKEIREKAYDYSTNLIILFGEPRVIAEETIGGVECQKIEFTPDVYSVRAFEELNETGGNYKKVLLTIWMGKFDNLIHKIDFRLDFSESGQEPGQEVDSFIQVVLEMSGINQDQYIETPSGVRNG